MTSLIARSVDNIRKHQRMCPKPSAGHWEEFEWGTPSQYVTVVESAAVSLTFPPSSPECRLHIQCNTMKTNLTTREQKYKLSMSRLKHSDY